ncbi:MAG: class I SAM-dependent methyltransferase [Betaproteobacteria bacterium]
MDAPLERFSPHRAATACTLCQSSDGTLVAVSDRHGKPLPVTCCAGCGLTYVDPIPTREELARFYAERYRLEYKQASQPAVRHIYRAGKVALGRLRVASLLADPGTRALDCGAGCGEFTYLMSSRGYRMTGIEPNDGYREFARREYGVDLRAGTLDDVDFDSGEFDLITMFHVLEHVPDPAAALRRLGSWLRPGGHLYIEVPNALTAVSSPSNLYHRAHLYYFAAAPLASVGERAGLIPVQVDGSASQANITAVFRKPAAGATSRMTARPSAHDAVVRANRERTLGRYLTAGSTLSNVLPKILNRGEERRAAASGRSGRQILDALYDTHAPQLPAA